MSLRLAVIVYLVMDKMDVALCLGDAYNRYTSYVPS